MPNLVLPEGASPARRPTAVRLQIVMPSPAAPEGEGWLHEIKHDGHRLVAIIDGHGRLRLISRNGYDRTDAFGAPSRLPIRAPPIAAGSQPQRGAPTLLRVTQWVLPRIGPEMGSRRIEPVSRNQQRLAQEPSQIRPSIHRQGKTRR